MPLVSVDFNHDPASATFDMTQTQVVDGTFVRVLSWYDSEWGFSNRMNDVAALLGGYGGAALTDAKRAEFVGAHRLVQGMIGIEMGPGA